LGSTWLKKQAKVSFRGLNLENKGINIVAINNSHNKGGDDTTYGRKSNNRGIDGDWGAHGLWKEIFNLELVTISVK
jgi:hypothetical protein